MISSWPAFTNLSTPSTAAATGAPTPVAAAAPVAACFTASLPASFSIFFAADAPAFLEAFPDTPCVIPDFFTALFFEPEFTIWSLRLFMLS